VGKSSISQVLAAQVRNEIVAEVVARAEALSIPKGRYAAMVLEWWEAKGFPAISPADQAMQDLKVISRQMVAEPPAAPSRKKSA
jgi:hypothetical protein